MSLLTFRCVHRETDLKVWYMHYTCLRLCHVVLDSSRVVGLFLTVINSFSLSFICHGVAQSLAQTTMRGPPGLFLKLWVPGTHHASGGVTESGRKTNFFPQLSGSRATLACTPPHTPARPSTSLALSSSERIWGLLHECSVCLHLSSFVALKWFLSRSECVHICFCSLFTFGSLAVSLFRNLITSPKV